MAQTIVKIIHSYLNLSLNLTTHNTKHTLFLCFPNNDKLTHYSNVSFHLEFVIIGLFVSALYNHEQGNIWH